MGPSITEIPNENAQMLWLRKIRYKHYMKEKLSN
jgi:hypothetical protein